MTDATMTPETTDTDTSLPETDATQPPAFEDPANDGGPASEAPADDAPVAEGEAPETPATETPADEAEPAAAEPGGDAPTPTPEQLQALGAGMEAQKAQAAAGDDALREEDGVFDGPFDPQKALKAIFRLNEEVERAKREWDGDKERAAASKKAYDAEVEALQKLIDRYRDQQAGHARSGQQPLKTVPPDQRPCAYELKSGQPCGVCRARKPGEKMPGPDAAAHPEHPDHEAVAKAALGEACEELAVGLEEKALLFVDPAELMRLRPEDRQALTSWADSGGPVPPALVTERAHAADMAGEAVQTCQWCPARLWFSEAGYDPYAEGALVGLDCDRSRQPEAADATAAPAADAPEPARTPKKRGSKKGPKKHDPEAERAKQAEAGKAQA
ncbi:MAG: hypothetical protein AB7O67_23295 [Vicinamibacterales bacterium]